MLNPKVVEYCEKYFAGSTSILSQLEEYKKLLLMENLKMNLIGKSTIDDFDQRHILDCIQIHKYIKYPNKLIADLGSGAGLPGILLSILGCPNIHLIEKSPKKSQFLNLCKSRLGLNFKVHNALIEDIKKINFEIIVARAFAPIIKIMTNAKHLANHQTTFLLLKGKSYLSELKELNPEQYIWKIYPSITSEEARVINIHLK